jgi:hypothetical protein
MAGHEVRDVVFAPNGPTVSFFCRFRAGPIRATVGGMDSDDIHADIARIEARIEELGEAIERCRKLALAAKIAIAAGAAWIVLTLAGAIPYVPYMTVAALAAVIGGVVLAGSNSTTWQQTEAALAASDAMRADLIERLQLRVVQEPHPTLH